MAQQQKQQYSIIAAPSKFDLMTALFHGRSGEDHPRLKFTVQKRVPQTTNLIGTPTIVEVTINGVTREDGSGESWIISGYVSASSGHSTDFKGWYRTSDRKGWMEF